MRLFDLQRCLFVVLLVLALFVPAGLFSQKSGYNSFRHCFENAYKAYPQIPQGLLEAVSFTNTHFIHLTEADFANCGDGHDMPHSYGLMGLVRDGKGVFRENIHRVSQLSGFSEDDILSDPAVNVMSYAAAYAEIAGEKGCQSLADAKTVIRELSELPLNRAADEIPMDMMLYSVFHFMSNEYLCGQYGIAKTDVNMNELFGDKLPYLQAGGVVTLREGVDYPGAVWEPAASCNFGERAEPITAVVIHDTEGSFAGSLSWFQNCQAGSSAHYLIRSSDGYIVQLVRESDKAWHARDANRYSIGIEHEGYASNPDYYTDTMYKTSAALVRNICDRYDAIGSHYVFYRDTLDDGTALDYGLHELGGDNPSTGKSYCVRICGHQHLYNQSHTDPGPYWNWNYYYKLINIGVGDSQVLEGLSGVFDNPTAKNYPNSERSLTLIRVPEGNTVKLDFQSFNLETNYDFMWIYDGDNEFAPLIGRFNTQSPGTVLSSGNELLVEFRSDCNDNAAGWHAVWTAQGSSTTTELWHSACDSYTWNGEEYDHSGDYTYKTTSVLGLDSVVILHLTINHSAQNEIIVIGYDSYTWNGVTYTVSGDFQQSFLTSMGCDSIVTMHLTLNLLPNITVTGDTLVYEGQAATLTASGADTYHWSTGDTTATIVVYPTTTTTYYVQGFDAQGASIGYGSLEVEVLPDGLAENADAELNIFPNPASQTIVLNFSGQCTADIDICDVCGRVVETVRNISPSSDIDVSGLKTGVYFVRCFVGGTSLRMVKFIKM